VPTGLRLRYRCTEDPGEGRAGFPTKPYCGRKDSLETNIQLWRRRLGIAGICALGAAAAMWAAGAHASARSAISGQQSAPTPLVHVLGTIKSIKGTTLIISSDDGSEITAVVKQGARMLNVEPGEKDLSHAAKIEIADLQVGDRVRIRGPNSPDGKFVVALEVIAIKHLDIQAKHERERADWQKRGIGGLVKEVDPAANAITLTVGALSGARTVTIHPAPNAVLRRYAADSVQFDDAKPAPLADIKPGDQLRARGDRSADGAEFQAEEVVSGTFRNIAGTITSVDAEAGRMVVMDVLSNKPVTLAISAKSQLRKLPPEVAMGLAARMRGAGANGAQGGQNPPGAAGSGPPPQQPPAQGAATGGAAGGAPGAPGGAARSPRGDFQQIVNRLPQVTLADLPKGEAIICVATGGASSSEVTAITLLGGVEPLLTASPRGSQAFTLSPWSIGGGGVEGGDINP